MKDIKSFSYVDNMITCLPFEIMFGYRNQIIDKFKEYGAKAKSHKLLESANGGAWSIHASRRLVIAVILDDLLTSKDNSPIEELIAQFAHLNTKFREAFLNVNHPLTDLENSDEVYIRWWTWLLCKSIGKEAIDYALDISPRVKANFGNIEIEEGETFIKNIKHPALGEIVFNIGPEDLIYKKHTESGLKWSWTIFGALRGFKDGYYNFDIISKFEKDITRQPNIYYALVHELLHLDTIFRIKLGIKEKDKDSEYCKWWSKFICQSIGGEALNFARCLENNKHSLNH